MKIIEASRKIEVNLSAWQLGNGLNKSWNMYIGNTMQPSKRMTQLCMYWHGNMSIYLVKIFIEKRVSNDRSALVWLRHSHAHNLGVHFDNRSWRKEVETEVCVVGRAVAGCMVQRARSEGKAGMCKRKPHEGEQFLFCSLPVPGALTYAQPIESRNWMFAEWSLWNGTVFAPSMTTLLFYSV